ncbi:MAG: Crp/Fnr family transcriptional regulator [Sphaerochaeta sp.]|jgi:CRP/FNR family transcriptional regulator|uniref:Crp/Fnr family transcriptional regulator n=1 Tax=Sphaerochaeta sp. TaxID=1972642 RepID=UPI003D0F5FBD
MAFTCNACANFTSPCLHNVPLFQHLDPSQIRAVQSLIIQHTLPSGQVLLREGERSDRLFIVRYGSLKVVRYGSEGTEYVLDTLFPGDFYGGDTLFSQGRVAQTVIAEGECGICTITGAHLEQLMLFTPQIALKVITYLNTKLEQYRLQVEMLSTKDVEKRLCMYLLDRSRRSDSLELSISQEDVGNAIHLTKETVNRKLASLQTQGLVKVKGKRKLQIINMRGLQEQAY